MLTEIFRQILIRGNWFENKVGILILKSLALSLFLAIVHFYAYDSIRALLEIPKSNEEGDLSDLSEAGRVMLNVLSVWIYHVLWIILYFAFHFAYKSRQESIKNLQLEALQTEIELNNLKSQLNPHFMFNSLNSIRALVDIEPKSAKQSITQLSNILRSSLQMGRKNVVPISEEINLVDNYLKMEKIRFEERLQYEFIIDQELNSFEIPPLIIQTLVENSIKHGISSLISGGKVMVEVKKMKDKKIIRVSNNGKLKKAITPISGIGIENTQRRLDLVYGKAASFKLYEENNLVHAEITIK